MWTQPTIVLQSAFCLSSEMKVRFFALLSWGFSIPSPPLCFQNYNFSWKTLAHPLLELWPNCVFGRLTNKLTVSEILVKLTLSTLQIFLSMCFFLLFPHSWNLCQCIKKWMFVCFYLEAWRLCCWIKLHFKKGNNVRSYSCKGTYIVLLGLKYNYSNSTATLAARKSMRC